MPPRRLPISRLPDPKSAKGANASEGNFSPHLCVGFLFLVVHWRPLLLLLPALSHTTHTQPIHTHTTYSHTHTTLSHTTLSLSELCVRELCVGKLCVCVSELCVCVGKLCVCE